MPTAQLLRAIARLERKGDLRSPRLTEPGLMRWNRVRRKLDHVDFIALLCEDLAAAFPYPFDLSRWHEDPLGTLDDAAAAALISEAIAEDASAPQAFLRQAARDFGLPPGGNIADLPKVQPHQRALELPGTGGRVAAQQALEHGVAVHDRFVFVADTDAERACLGLALVEVRANPPEVITSEQALARLAKGERFDHVFGVKGHPSAMALVKQAGVEVRWA